MNDPSRVVDWPPPRRPQRRNRGVLLLVAVLAAIMFGGGTALSYYVESLWFDSLGYVDVFWTTLNVQAAVFSAFAAVTFLVLYGAYVALKPPRLGELTGVPILINGQPIKLPVEPVLRLIALGGSLAIAFVTGAGMMANWETLALYWYGRSGPATPLVDPIFARPLNFYLFTLPAWEMITGWLLTLGVLVCAVAGFFVVIGGGSRLLSRSRAGESAAAWRGLSIGFAVVLLMLAARVYLGRFEQLFDDRGGAIFSGVAYTDAHVSLTGMLVVAAALALGAAMALVNAVAAPKLRWLIAAVVPAVVCYVVVGVLASYVSGFIVKPNELVRETPYITHNIEFTRRAYGLDRIVRQAFPAETSIEAVDLANNQATIQNIRLWDWHALQDTLRQIQAIRTYYEFPDVDIDRYVIDGSLRQMMVAARELNVDRLPESGRNWINTKLIYTHGYGVTMNPVNGFTPEGLPTLVLSDMPVQSTIPSLKVTRPEIYFGQLTNTDVYVKTRQKEFNYPQGETNNLTSYEGTGGIVLGGFFRRLLIALDRGDITKLPFSDDVTPDSRLLMRRNIRDRITSLAPFLTLDPDPYIVVGDDGRLSWIADGFTTSDTFPYARHSVLGRDRINYIRNSVKAVVDAYDGTTTFYVFDTDDPIIAAYRGIFPTLFKDASAMPPGLRSHVRYPELLLKVQAAEYGLYHMDAPGVFYNREDLWTVASQVSQTNQREQATQPMEPNFVLMTLPGETKPEFIEILPFTPANRNNLIGWIAGAQRRPALRRGDRVRLSEDEARRRPAADRSAHRSEPAAVRPVVVVEPAGLARPARRADRHSHRPRAALRRTDLPAGRAQPDAAAAPRRPRASGSARVRADARGCAAQSLRQRGVHASRTVAVGFRALPRLPPRPREKRRPRPRLAPLISTGSISEAARDLAEYQRLTAEGKLGEAGQKLEALKRALDQLDKRPR